MVIATWGKAAVRCALLAISVLVVAALTIVPNAGAATVATASGQSCAVMSGVLHCWGGNSTGALGFQTGESSVPYATPVGVNLRGVTDIVGTSTGSGSSGRFCAVASGAASCWGTNAFGTIGIDTTAASLGIPTALPALVSGVTKVDMNATRTCGLANGGAFCWGSAFLGNGTKADSKVPVAVSGMGAGVTDIAVGWRSSCVLRDGTVSCWGNGIHGQLGGGTGAEGVTGPVPLPGPATAIDAGTDMACAVVNGGLWCWGSNGSGRLGVPSAKSGAVPVNTIAAGSGVVDVSANSGLVCALLGDGSVRCWGENLNGQVGNGSAGGIVETPTPVVGLPGKASSVAVTVSHACAAVGADVYCWGSNGRGQLGNGTVGGKSGTPVKVQRAAKATVSGSARAVRLAGRKATIGKVTCPQGAGTCAVTMPATVNVRLGGVTYRVAVAKLAPIAAGGTGAIVVTVPQALKSKLGTKSVRVSVRVSVTNTAGTLVKSAAAPVKK